MSIDNFKMKILGISGSPRKEGNTSLLVERALGVCEKAGAETEFISLAGLDIGYYVGGSQRDDADVVFESMKECDALIVGSPTYFASVSAQLKALFDRSLPLRKDNYRLSGKVGGAIAVGGSRNGGQEFVIRDIHNWMLFHEMIVVADRKTAHFGGIAVGGKPGDVLGDEVGMETVDNLALNVMETARRISGKI